MYSIGNIVNNFVLTNNVITWYGDRWVLDLLRGSFCYIWNHYVVHLKLIGHCMSIIHEGKRDKKKKRKEGREGGRTEENGGRKEERKEGGREEREIPMYRRHSAITENVASKHTWIPFRNFSGRLFLEKEIYPL